jgi:predicted PurR-regulated permease PerM
MVPLAMKNHLNINTAKLLKSLMYPLASAIPLYFLLNQFSKKMPVTNWFNLGVVYCIMCIFAIFYLYIFCLNKNEKSFLASLVKSKIERKLEKP